MTDGLNEAQRANIRLDHINGDLKEIKSDVKENTRLIGKSREDFAGLRTEVRIVGGFVILAVSSLIAAYIGGLF